MKSAHWMLTLLLVLALLAPGASASLAQQATLSALPAPAHASAPAAPGDEYWAAGFNLLGMNNSVLALAAGPDGSLYAGGEFTTAGGIAANYIVRWDGSQWHPLGSGMGGETTPSVRALTFGPDGSLFTGGDFTTAGGKPSSYIAQWTGSASPVRRYLPLILHQ